MQQAALPGLAPDPYRLDPIRPSYAKMVRQLETVAREAGTPVHQLTSAHIHLHARRVGWSPATVVNLTRVASAHGLNIDPHTSQRPKARPSNFSLSTLTITSPREHPAQQRTAALAALMWHQPARLAWWRRVTFADLAIDGTTVVIAGRTCRDAAAVTIWRDTASRLYPNIPTERIPFLVRLDDIPLAVSQRTVEQDWVTWMNGISLDRWRAWAIDAGAVPVDRGRERHRHR